MAPFLLLCHHFLAILIRQAVLLKCQGLFSHALHLLLCFLLFNPTNMKQLLLFHKNYLIYLLMTYLFLMYLYFLLIYLSILFLNRINIFWNHCMLSSYSIFQEKHCFDFFSRFSFYLIKCSNNVPDEFSIICTQLRQKELWSLNKCFFFKQLS